jgi:hypothetical protein
MTVFRFHSRLGLFLIAVVMMTSRASTQSPPAEEIPAPAVRVVTHVVLVDVVVTDKKGEPVPQLGADDFVLEENGKLQKIASVPAPKEAFTGVPTLPPGVYSNRPQYRSPGGPITVILLDALNTEFSDQATPAARCWLF